MSTARPGQAGASPGLLPAEQTDWVLAVAAGCVLLTYALGAVFAVAGGAAATVTGEPTSPAGPHAWPDLALQVLRHPGRPGAAFAHSAPSPGVFWPIAVSLIGVAVGLAAWIARLVGSWWTPSRAATPARWADRRVERKVAVPADAARRPGRLVAGYGLRTRQLIAGEDCISAVGFGPNGSGKTTGLIAPNVAEWQGPVVMTTTKLADLALVHAVRAARGPVYVIAPAGAGSFPTTRWDPVAYAADAAAADRMAEWLVEASGHAADPRARPWLVQARAYLGPLLLAAHLAGGGLTAFVRWVYDGADAADDVKAMLHEHGLADEARAYASTFTLHPEGIGSVLFTAYGLAEVYRRPSATPSQAEPFDPTEFVAHPDATLVVVAPESDLDRYAPALTALLASVIHAAETRAASTGPLTPRLLIAVDEAGNMFRYPRLANLLTTARGNGIQLLLVYHDLAQLEHVYGTALARTVLSNAKLRILLPGQGDLETLRYFSALLGQARVRRDSHTRGRDGAHSVSRGDQPEDLAPLHMLRELPVEQAIAQYRNLPPIRVRLRLTHVDRRLRRLLAERADSSDVA